MSTSPPPPPQEAGPTLRDELPEELRSQIDILFDLPSVADQELPYRIQELASASADDALDAEKQTPLLEPSEFGGSENGDSVASRCSKRKRRRQTPSSTLAANRKNAKEKLKRVEIQQKLSELHRMLGLTSKESDKMSVVEGAIQEIAQLRLKLKNIESAAWDFTVPILEANPSILDLAAQQISDEARFAVDNDKEEDVFARMA